MTTNRHQGKFHLLAIFAIPVLLVLAFVVQNWWLLGSVAFVFLVLTVWLFRKK